MGQSLLGYLIDFLVQQHRDAERGDAELWRRDRAIGLRLGIDPGRPVDQVCAWLDRVGDQRLPGRTAVAAQRAVNLLLAILGLALGWVTAQVLLYYDGSEPVNVVATLSVFVGLQLLLVLLAGLAMLPRGLLRLLPGAPTLQEGLGLLSPGRLHRLAHRFLPQEVRRTAAGVLAAGGSRQRLFARVERWALLVSSQCFATAFNLGALLACASLIAFTDLAFSWNTTLQLQPAVFHRITEVLAAPWSWLLPQAAPSLELVEATRYFRFQEGVLPYGDGADPVRLGQWWPFLVACIAFYGLGPRLFLLALAGFRYRRAVRHTFRRLPGMDEVLDRLNRELVETRAREPEVRAAPAPAAAPGLEESAPPPGRPCAVVNWARVDVGDTGEEELVRRWTGWLPAGTFHAGGANRIEEDLAVVEAIRRSVTPEQTPVVILVKGWEPAMLEFLDFLEDLRRALGEGHPVVVVPWGRDPHGQLGMPPGEDLDQWRRRVRSVGDPWTSVRAPRAGG